MSDPYASGSPQDPNQPGPPPAPQYPQYGGPQYGGQGGQAGQGGYGQQPGYPAYGGYPGQYGQYGVVQPQKKSRAGLWITLGVIAAILVFCVAPIAVIAVGIGQASDEFTADRDDPGGVNNPIEVELGEAFEIQGMEFAEGWVLAPPEEFSGQEITGLKVTNKREDKDPDNVSIEVKFYTDKELIETVSCRSNGSFGYDESTTLRCGTSNEPLPAYDRITVSNSY